MSTPVMSYLLKKLELTIPQGIPIEQAEEMIRERMKDPSFTEKIIEAAEYVVPRVVVEPRIVQAETPSETALTVDELAPGDLFEIFNEAVDFSGLTGAAARMREKFRKQPSRQSRRKPRARAAY